MYFNIKHNTSYIHATLNYIERDLQGFDQDL